MYSLLRITTFLSRAFAELDYLIKRLTGKAAKIEDLNTIVEKLRGLEPGVINEYFRTAFSYKAEKIDYSMHYLVFLKSKQGDCDDYAHLAARVLEQIGYSVYIVCTFAKNGHGHAVCVASKDGKVYGFGNWPLMTFETDDFAQIGKEICKTGLGSENVFTIKFDSKWNWQYFYREN